MQVYVIIPDIPPFIQLALTVTINNCDPPLVGNNDKLLAKFHCGTLLYNTMRLMSLFESLLEHLLEFLLITARLSMAHNHLYLTKDILYFCVKIEYFWHVQWDYDWQLNKSKKITIHTQISPHGYSHWQVSTGLKKGNEKVSTTSVPSVTNLKQDMGVFSAYEPFSLFLSKMQEQRIFSERSNKSQ